MPHPVSRAIRGFTLVELMLALAVLGVLLAVAVPLYQDYTTRARVAQLLTNIDTLRTVFHTRNEVEGGIPKFTRGDVGKVPSELSGMPLGDELLHFEHLQLWLFQSSSHYGPFDGKEVPYLALTATGHDDSRYLRALAHALPHSAYAWIVEPVAMVVPLLDAEARHASHAPPQKPATGVQPATASANAQPAQQPAQPLSCAPGQEKVTFPAGMSPSGAAFDICVSPCGPGESRDASNPLSCVPATQTAQVTAPATTGPGTGAPMQSTQSTQSATGGGNGPTALQQYDDCVAHVLAGHPHGHAYGLLKQCERRYPH